MGVKDAWVSVLGVRIQKFSCFFQKQPYFPICKGLRNLLNKGTFHIPLRVSDLNSENAYKLGFNHYFQFPLYRYLI